MGDEGCLRNGPRHTEVPGTVTPRRGMQGKEIGHPAFSRWNCWMSLVVKSQDLTRLLSG